MNPQGKHDLRINFKKCMFFIDAIVTSIDFDMQLQMDSLVKYIISDLIPIIDRSSIVVNSLERADKHKTIGRKRTVIN